MVIIDSEYGYIVECVFLYESHIECGSVRKRLGKFSNKLPRVTIPSTTGTCKLVNKVKSAVFWMRNQVKLL